MAKLKTTKQHLLDKLTLSKKLLHERHKKMSQYGQNGKHNPRDETLETAFAPVEFDTSQCADLHALCQLRSAHFLTMAEIFIGQMDNELHREVASHVMEKYLQEDNRYLEELMEYKPQKAREEIKATYGNLDNYTEALITHYGQVVFENRVSKLFSAVAEQVHKSSRAEVGDAKFRTLCRTVNDLMSPETYNFQDIDGGAYIGGMSITPEEYSEIISILAKNNLDDRLFKNAVFKARQWLEEIQSKHNPDKSFYNVFFNVTLQNRLKDLLGNKNEQTVRESAHPESGSESEPEDFFDWAERQGGNIDELAVVDKFKQQEAEMIVDEFNAELSPNHKLMLDLELRGYSHNEIAEEVNNKFPETFKGSGKPKPFKTENVPYHLKKITACLEKYLRRQGLDKDDFT